MRRAMREAFAAALGLAVLTGLAHLTAWALFCERSERLVTERARHGGSLTDADSGRALAGEVIFVCRQPHCFAGGSLCHADRACYCVPSAGDPGPAEVERRLAARGLAPSECRLDERTPRDDDQDGECPRGRCLAHLGK